MSSVRFSKPSGWETHSREDSSFSLLDPQVGAISNIPTNLEIGKCGRSDGASGFLKTVRSRQVKKKNIFP